MGHLGRLKNFMEKSFPKGLAPAGTVNSGGNNCLSNHPHMTKVFTKVLQYYE